ncbi:MAG: hypothetical protein M0C28_36595 [Candidatus Moduliflexus flocculans]|nr:hypothetical protein [Candidatus Moduliflexus flocculans]
MIDAEQDHGHHLVERLLHQDGGFDGGQSALDAVTFNGDLGRQVLQSCGGLPCTAEMIGIPRNMKPKNPPQHRMKIGVGIDQTDRQA